MDAPRESDADRRARHAARKSAAGGGAAGSSSPDDASLQLGDTLAGTWRVGAMVGEGTFSRIYDAQQLINPAQPMSPLQHAVVLKVNKLRPQMMPAASPAASPTSPAAAPSDSDGSFAYEAAVFRAVQAYEQAQAGRQPPGAAPVPLPIPRLVEHSRCCMPAHASGVPARAGEEVEYMLLEKCGVDLSALRTHWQKNGGGGSSADPVPVAVELACMCLAALERFHRAGYVHRDIKPSNFLTHLDSAQAAQRVLLTDFGLSRRRETLAAAPPASPDNKFIGKALYASFTAHRQESQSPRDDVVSLLFVMLDLLFGDLPWKAQCDKRQTQTQTQRWQAVAAEKERLLGPAVCAEAVAAAGALPSAEWLPGIALPPQLRIIFHQLHSLTPGATVDYSSIRSLLLRLQQDMRAQLSAANRPCPSLQQLLQQHADTRAQTAAAEAAQLRQQEAAVQAEQLRIARERQQAEEVERALRLKEQHMQEYRASVAAKNAAAQANAERAAAQLKQQQEWQPAAALQSSAPAARSALHVFQLADSIAQRKPRPFVEWPRRVRDLLSDVCSLPGDVNRLDLSKAVASSATPPDCLPPAPGSLESLWDSVEWGSVARAAATDKEQCKVRFVHWKGEWAHVMSGLSALKWDELVALRTYCLSSPSPLPLQLADLKPGSNLLLVGIPTTLAFLYELLQQATRGTKRVPGLGATPLQAPAAPATGAVARPAAASAGDKSVSVITARIAKKLVVEGADGTVAASAMVKTEPKARDDLKTSSAAARPTTSTKSPALTPAQTKKLDAKPATVGSKTKPIDISTSAKPMAHSAKPTAPATKPVALGAKLGPSSGSAAPAPSKPKHKRTVFSSSSSSSDNSSSSGSDLSSDDDDGLLVPGASPKKASRKVSKKKSKDKASSAAASTPPQGRRRRLKKIAADDDEDEQPHARAGDDEDADDEEEKVRVAATTKRAQALAEVQRKHQAEIEAKERRAEEERLAEENKLLEQIRAKLHAGVQQLSSSPLAESDFDYPAVWRDEEIASRPVSRVSSRAVSRAASPEPEVAVADPKRMRARARFDKFGSTLGLWAWGSDYEGWPIGIEDVLNRARILDELAWMEVQASESGTSIMIKKWSELHENWRNRFEIDDEKQLAPMDTDPNLNAIIDAYKAKLEAIQEAGDEDSDDSEGEGSEEEKSGKDISKADKKSGKENSKSSKDSGKAESKAKPKVEEKKSAEKNDAKEVAESKKVAPAAAPSPHAAAAAAAVAPTPAATSAAASTPAPAATPVAEPAPIPAAAPVADAVSAAPTAAPATEPAPVTEPATLAAPSIAQQSNMLEAAASVKVNAEATAADASAANGAEPVAAAVSSAPDVAAPPPVDASSAHAESDAALSAAPPAPKSVSRKASASKGKGGRKRKASVADVDVVGMEASAANGEASGAAQTADNAPPAQTAASTPGSAGLSIDPAAAPSADASAAAAASPASGTTPSNKRARRGHGASTPSGKTPPASVRKATRRSAGAASPIAEEAAAPSPSNDAPAAASSTEPAPATRSPAAGSKRKLPVSSATTPEKTADSETTADLPQPKKARQSSRGK